jgi:hypothetical protein
MPIVVTKPKHQPKRNTFKLRPHNYKEPTKSELRAMLTQAVENTK